MTSVSRIHHVASDKSARVSPGAGILPRETYGRVIVPSLRLNTLPQLVNWHCSKLCLDGVLGYGVLG